MSIRLPEYYLQWINAIDVSSSRIYRGQLWHIYGKDKLEENVLIAHSAVKVCDQLYAYINELAKTTRAPMTLEHSKRCVTIAYQDDMLLYYDIAQHHQLFRFTLSTGSIERFGFLQNFLDEVQATG
ncbi:hypothetical protein [Celerinatantimonas diazotrophica]|uniref:Uncharacterized protein n=1 Tax=Celerinatantimonas diazotrophica TaxID=412034 RepID=A0A4R1K1W3_9GAMM|nr:hypothetical protein [Celerinatantimonas diazotrophica]TCK57797.1 hypothetical protein EV690_1493 [Celerinatantimonas diazotrophica]CAG9298139.1 hypothetical protein CEDIAZO_03334 [Celerinatantimonas diazotrophica]